MLDLDRKSCCQKADKSQTKAGFTLVELAVVLTLVGLVVAGSISGFFHYRHKEQIRTTDIKMAKVLDSLSVYAQRYNRIPCPATSNATGANVGMEKDNRECFRNTGDINGAGIYANATGIVPWRELGLSESDVKDAWGNYFTYKPTPNLTVDNTNSLLVSNSNAGVHDACRTPAWYNGSDHLNRSKALFCCNAPPSSGYLASTGHSGATVTLPQGWRDQAIVAAGAIPAGTTLNAASTLPANVPVVATNAWIDKDANRYDTFNTPFDPTLDRQSPPLRASGLAVSLVSHGANAKFSFIAGALNRLATDATGAATENAGADERFNYEAPQAVAATVQVPKVSDGRLDPMGKRAGASDDRVVYMRTDQLYSRVGNATCFKPVSAGSSAEIPDMCAISPTHCQCPADLTKCEPIRCAPNSPTSACYRAASDGHINTSAYPANMTRPAAMSTIATYGGKHGYRIGDFYRMEAMPTNYTPIRGVPRDYTCQSGGETNCKIFGYQFDTASVGSCDPTSCGCMTYPQVGDNCSAYFADAEGNVLNTLAVTSINVNGNSGITINCGTAPRLVTGTFTWNQFVRPGVPASVSDLYEANIPVTCKKPNALCSNPANANHWSCTPDICDDPIEDICNAPGYSGDFPCKCTAQCNPCGRSECTVTVCDDPNRPHPMLPAGNESGDCTCCSNPPTDLPSYNPGANRYHVIHPVTGRREAINCTGQLNFNVNDIVGCP